MPPPNVVRLRVAEEDIRTEMAVATTGQEVRQFVAAWRRV